MGHRAFVAAAALVVAACGGSTPTTTPGAPSTASTSAPSQVATAAPTAAPTVASTPTITAPPAASGCAEFLTAAEITAATGQTAAEGGSPTPGVPGEIVCNYGLGSNSLMLSIWTGDDLPGWYEDTAGQLGNAKSLSGLGVKATYGDGPMPFMSDALAVLGTSTTFTLYAIGSSNFGQAAMRSLAEIVLTRLE